MTEQVVAWMVFVCLAVVVILLLMDTKQQQEPPTGVLTDGWTFASGEAWRGDRLVSGESVSPGEVVSLSGLTPATLKDVCIRVSVMLWLGASQRQVVDFLVELCHSMGDTPLVGDKEFMVR